MARNSFAMQGHRVCLHAEHALFQGAKTGIQTAAATKQARAGHSQSAVHRPESSVRRIPMGSHALTGYRFSGNCCLIEMAVFAADSCDRAKSVNDSASGANDALCNFPCALTKTGYGWQSIPRPRLLALVMLRIRRYRALLLL